MQIILWLFITAIILQLGYWIIIFSKVAFVKVPTQPIVQNDFPISVIICGYNEGHNFKKFLPQILEQDYPNFEVIVVNDRSTDDSEVILEQFKTQYAHLKVLNLKDFDRQQIGKKVALSKGLAAAKHEVVLLTDADCYPASNQWIQWMSSAVLSQDIGIAYVPFDKRAGFLNRFLRYDKIYIAIQYLSFALWGIPYMGAGANLIYKKQLFFKNKGFERHKHIASGDDDLFISEVGKQQGIAVTLHHESFIYCEPKETWASFYRQKTRHISTSVHYNWYHQILLGLLAYSHFGVYIGLFLLAYFGLINTLVIGLFAFRWLVMLLLYARITPKFKEQDMLLWLPIMDFLYIFYYIIFTFPLLKGNDNRWE